MRVEPEAESTTAGLNKLGTFSGISSDCSREQSLGQREKRHLGFLQLRDPGVADVIPDSRRARRMWRSDALVQRWHLGPVYGPEYAKVLAMKRISIQDLKARLSVTIAEAQSGHTIVITRHNEAVAQLTPARAEHLHRGVAAGTGRLRPALKRGTKGRYLALLAEDRGGR